MDSKLNNGFIYYFYPENPEEKNNTFSPIKELNANSEKINTIKIHSNKIISISSKNILLQWDQEKEKEIDKENNIILDQKPSYIFPKIKFKSISLNKSVTLGLDINGNVLVWGQSTEGVLGLGFDISKVENPTILEDLKNIIQISLSEHHAIAINSDGVAYSWGTGKYGELGLERTIYSSVPQQIMTDTIYSKVFCSNLISCFLDFEGHFHYYGVVIKQLSGNGSTLTIKSLLDEQAYNDGKMLFLEKQIEELENEKFKNILIGNGFIILLSFNGSIFILEYNDKLTKLYSKYNLDNICLTSDGIFGFAKEEKNNINNYHLLRWKSHYNTENDLYSDSWSITIWKFIDDNNILDNCELVDINSTKNYIFLKLINRNDNNEEMVHLSDSNKSLNLEEEEKEQMPKNIMNNIKLEFENEYNDSYNLKYKRNQLNNQLQDLSAKNSIFYNSFYAIGKSKSIPFNYNQNVNKTVLFQNRVNSPLLNNNSRNIFDKNAINLSNKNNTIKGNFIYNSNGEILSKNKNDINDNVNIYELDDNNKSQNKSYITKKNKNAMDDMNYNSDENEFIKNELNKYKSEVDNIINNYKKKQQSKSFSMLGKIKKNGNNNSNNIYYIDKYKEDNTSNDNSNNELIKAFSITKSISNPIQNNDNSNIANSNNIKKKKSKKISNKAVKFYDEEKKDIKNNIIRKSRNKERLSPESKRTFKDKKLKYLVEHLSLIEEESEPSLSAYKRNRKLSFSKSSLNSNMRTKNNKVKDLKKNIYNININDENSEENIKGTKNEDINDISKDKYTDLDDEINKKRTKRENNISEKNNNIKKHKKSNLKEKNNKNKENQDDSQEYEEDKNKGNYYNEKEKNDINNKEKYKNNINGKAKKIRKKNNNNNNLNGQEDKEEEDEDEEVENEEREENEYNSNKNDQNINNKNKKRKKTNNYKDNNSNENNKENIQLNKNSYLNSEEEKYEENKNKIKNKKIKIKNENNSNSELEEEVEEEEECVDENGNIVKKRKIKKNPRKNLNSKNKKDTKINIEEEEELDDLNEINNVKYKNAKEKNNIRLKSQSKESDISNNNNSSPAKSFKFKNTFGKTMNEANNVEEKNPFKNNQKINNSSSKKNNQKKNQGEENFSNNEEEENEEEEEEDDLDNEGNNHLKKEKKQSKNKIKNKEKIINSKLNRRNANNTKENYDDTEINKYSNNEIENKNNMNNKKKNKITKNNNANNINNNARTIMTYFIYLIEYYMKKKVFSLYANKIANYQKYLEKKFALKILYRVLKKRIIFYKIKFLHRYKKIYKYLCKNNIETITQIYSEESSSYYFFSENNNNNNNKINYKNNKTEKKNALKINTKINPKINKTTISKSINNKNKEKINNIKNIKGKK